MMETSVPLLFLDPERLRLRLLRDEDREPLEEAEPDLDERRERDLDLLERDEADDREDALDLLREAERDFDRLDDL